MNITVFTSNQPRHLALVNSLSSVADKLYVVYECGAIAFHETLEKKFKTEAMRKYFSFVLDAEEAVFGPIAFSPSNIHSISLKMGDLSSLDMNILKPILHSDLYVVFGASYIKNELVDFLIEKNAINIHMGVSPYYRGAACNFWSIYDGNADLVGATIHMLTQGLDSGGILFHAFPKREKIDPFLLGMKSVKAAHTALVDSISSGKIKSITPVPQDKSLQIRYSRNSDFTDEIALEYLSRKFSADDVDLQLSSDSLSRRELINPVYC